MSPLETLFTDSYSRFTRWMSRIQVDEKDSKVRVPEKTIRCVWNDQLFKTPQLKTTGGDDLEIIFPGHWNFGPGPDFKHTAIKVNGRLIEGDVEIQVYSSDFKTLDQASDPDHEKVILRVFLWKSGNESQALSASPSQAFRSDSGQGGKIHELELKEHLTRGILDLNDELDFDGYPAENQPEYGQCHPPLARLSTEQLTDLLNAAGDARIVTKMERFHDRVIINGYEQTFYEGIAEALGYPYNKEPFQKLAGAIRLNTLRELLPKRIRKEEKILHIQSLLFGAAGLIGFKSLDISGLIADDREYFEKLHALWEKKYRARVSPPALTEGSWKFGGIRPANSPFRRIAGLAHLLVKHEEDGLFSDFMQGFRRIVADKKEAGQEVTFPASFFDFFCMEAEDDYWASHYSPGGKQLAKPQLLIGPARSREITINIVIPIGLIFARASKSESLEAGLNALFQSGNKPGDNKLLRFMKHYIFGNKKDMTQVLVNDKQTQGLMQVYQDFCTQNGNDCLNCPFPEMVKKYFS